MRKVYVHIGLHKTGSTAIQHALRANQSVLNDAGYQVLVPHWDLPAVHGLFNPRYYGEKAGDQSLAKQHFDSWAAQNDGADWVISEEDFTPFYWPWRQHARHLRALLSSHDARIVLIVYVRRQDRIYESAYLQRLRDGSFLESIDVLANDRNTSPLYGNLDWFAKISEYAEVLQADEVSVANYDGLLATKHDLFADFCIRIGVSSERRAGLVPTRRVNQQLALPALMLSAWLRRSLPATIASPLVRSLFRLSALLPGQLVSHLNKPVLSDALREQIRQEYEAANQRLLASYFPDEASLFGW